MNNSSQTLSPDLAGLLLAGDQRPEVERACVELIDDYCRQRSGLRGRSMRTGLKLLRAIRKDAVDLGVARLLPRFCHALQPSYSAWRQSAQASYARFLEQHATDTASHMLKITDAEVAAADSTAIRAAYRSLRAFAATEIQRALPQVAELIQRQWELVDTSDAFANA